MRRRLAAARSAEVAAKQRATRLQGELLSSRPRGALLALLSSPIAGLPPPQLAKVDEILTAVESGHALSSRQLRALRTWAEAESRD